MTIMQYSKKRLQLAGAVVILSSAAISTYATGFDLPDQDAFAIGRGMAFVATADNPSAIYYNPAGISQLDGNNLRAGIYGVYVDPSYTPSGGGHTYHNEDKLHAIPQFYYTYGKKDFPVSFGLGVYSPFGLSLKWPQDTGFRTIVTQGALTTVAINPVVAFKLLPNLSVGGGVVVDYANVDLQQGLTPVPGNDLFRLKGDGWGVGYNLGLLWQPHEKISIGASFRSAITVNLNGQTESEMNSVQPTMYSSAGADFPLPLKAIFGISYRPTPKWNLEFDADYTDWNTVGTVNIHQASPPPIVPLSGVPLTLDWQASWYYEFGVTRYFDNGWHVNAGYIFNENSVPDANYTPLVADLDRHFFSIGTGYKGSRFDFDIAYQFGYGPTRTVTGSAPSPAGQTADGNYKFFSQAIAVSVGWHF
jgi:long-chain fatty acid transport protein